MITQALISYQTLTKRIDDYRATTGALDRYPFKRGRRENCCQSGKGNHIGVSKRGLRLLTPLDMFLLAALSAYRIRVNTWFLGQIGPAATPTRLV
jgi:hypothetical protein